jgi:hypothetical protein
MLQYALDHGVPEGGVLGTVAHMTGASCSDFHTKENR